MTDTYRKKLIEVALPLEAINKEAAREKSIRHGHPSTLHLWWARRPLAACRAVLFASLIDDPDQPDVPEALLQRIDRLDPPASRGLEWSRLSRGEQRRQKLFAFIEQLVKWENSTNERILRTARELILAATDGNPPPVLDPFCGGGSIPLEAQRLGLEAHASDLNPVAVLITKALIEMPAKFAGRPPVNPSDRATLGSSANWPGATGLAADVRYYGRWMRDEAERRIGHLYPKVQLPQQYGGGEATVIAWLWARTVRCPNPACGAQMPLVRSFALSTKQGKQAWVEPVVDRTAKTVRFEVRAGQGVPREGTVNRRGATCLVCGSPVPFDHVRAEGKAGRMSARLMAVVAEGHGSRIYLSPLTDQEELARSAKPSWAPEAQLPHNPRDFKTPNYGMRTFADLFTPRQLVALTTFSDLVSEARERVLADAHAAGLGDDGPGGGPAAYADAMATYLAFAVDRSADRGSSICSWDSSPKMEALRNTFARQAVPMTWDFAEGNPFSASSGNWNNNVEWVADAVAMLRPGQAGGVGQVDATAAADGVPEPVICTDPPYYDNIGYADLSDFFYVWLRRSLGGVYPDLFRTMLTPKSQELIATPYRFGGSKEKAQQFFEHGLGEAFAHMRTAQHPDYPLTVFYAFKQAETEDAADEKTGGSAVASTGWETMLEGLLHADFQITGTLPMRSELSNRMIASGTNALASSIVLVCRPRPASAAGATRRDFLAALKRDLPDALRKLQQGNIAPVDLAQAAIGPGMAVYSRYASVVDASGQPVPVRAALALINQALDEVLAEQEGEFDAATRWAIAWFDQFGMHEGPYGVAETLSKAKDTAIGTLVAARLVRAQGGKVRLLGREELAAEWQPDGAVRVWEVTQRLVRALQGEGTEQAAADLLARVGAAGETARDLAYRLYVTAERKRWAQEALAYNSLVVSWPEITALAAERAQRGPSQATLI